MAVQCRSAVVKACMGTEYHGSQDNRMDQGRLPGEGVACTYLAFGGQIRINQLKKRKSISGNEKKSDGGGGRRSSLKREV